MKKSISPRAALPQLEALESRLLLTGTVTVQVVIATQILQINGDGSDNHISIAQTGLGAYTITGLDNTLVKLGASTLGGQSVTGAVKDILVNMSVGAVNGNAGHDTVELASDLHVGTVALGTLRGTRGSFTYKGSGGDDRVFLGGTAATAPITFDANPVDGDTIQITDALGNTQTLEFDTGALHNPDNVQVVIAGTAADTMVNFLNAVQDTNLHLKADNTSSGGTVSCQLLAIPGTAGNQPIVVSSANITASDFAGGTDHLLDVLNVTGTMGNGSNLFTLGSLSTTPGNFASRIHGNLSVTGGNDADMVLPVNTAVHGTLTATLGAFHNKLIVVSSLDAFGERMGRVDGNLNYTGLGGDDIVDLALGEVGGKLAVDMGTAGASNRISAIGAILDGDVTYKAGTTGDNDIDFTAAFMGGKLGVTTGAGTDTVHLDGATIVGAVTLTLGTGTNHFSADQNNGVSANLLGAFSYTATSGANDTNSLEFISATLGSTLGVTLGASSDMIDLSGVNVAGKATLGLGTGSSDVEASTQPIFAGAFSFTATSVANDANTLNFVSPVFGGGVSVTAGASDDTVDLGGARVIGNTTLAMGAGMNIFQVLGPSVAKFFGNVSFAATGNFDDTVTVGDTTGTSTITGGLTIATGGGNDTIGFNANVAGNLSVNSGTSTNGDTVSGTGGVVTGTASITTGNSGLGAIVNIFDMTFMRSTTITNGTVGGGMTNNVDIEGSEFCRRDGTFSLTSGAGGSDVSVAMATGHARPTMFWRGVKFSLGSGGDLLKIGASTSAGGTGDANTYVKFLSATSAPIFNAGTGVNHLNYLFENGNALLPILNQFLLTPVINANF